MSVEYVRSRNPRDVSIRDLDRAIAEHLRLHGATIIPEGKSGTVRIYHIGYWSEGAFFYLQEIGRRSTFTSDIEKAIPYVKLSEARKVADDVSRRCVVCMSVRTKVR